MTIRGTTFSPRALGLMAFVAAAIVVVATLLVTRPAGSSDEVAATDSAATESVPSSIACDAIAADFGSPVTCTASGPADALVDWGDGTQSPIADAGTHLFASLGTTDVSVVGSSGEALATTSIEIAPDFAFTCEFGAVRPVYELAPALDTTVAPYDFVYLAEDGSSLYPGDADYPSTVVIASKTERSIVANESRVQSCRVASAAADALDGTVTWTVTSEWYNPVVTRTKAITPGVPAQWDGVQPIEIHVELDVQGHTASERRGVFFGGCG